MAEEDEPVAADLSKPITFRKPMASSRPKQTAVRRCHAVAPPSDDSPAAGVEEKVEAGTFSSPEVILPEAVVGRAAASSGRNIRRVTAAADGGGEETPAVKSDKAIKLSHLEEDDD